MDVPIAIVVVSYVEDFQAMDQFLTANAFDVGEVNVCGYVGCAFVSYDELQDTMEYLTHIAVAYSLFLRL